MKKILLNKRNTGSPNYKKYFALVDDEDFERVNAINWSIVKPNNTVLYAIANNIYMHRFIVDYKEVDHINHNGLDNRKENLRQSTRQQNSWNKRGIKNGTSPYKGVSYHTISKKWIAVIGTHFNRTYIGSYKTDIEAARAYNQKAKELFGEYAYLNKI